MTNTKNTLQGLNISADVLGLVFDALTDHAADPEEFAALRTLAAVRDALAVAAEDDLLSDKTEDLTPQELAQGIAEIITEDICGGDCADDIRNYSEQHAKKSALTSL